MSFYLSAYRADPTADYLFAQVRWTRQKIGPGLQIGLHVVYLQADRHLCRHHQRAEPAAYGTDSGRRHRDHHPLQPPPMEPSGAVPSQAMPSRTGHPTM